MRRLQLALGLALVTLFLTWMLAKSSLLDLVAAGATTTVLDLVALGVHGSAWLVLLAGAALIARSQTTGTQNGAVVPASRYAPSTLLITRGGGFTRDSGGAPGGDSGLNRTTRGGSEL